MSHIKMAIHMDDPPWDIFGLPRVIANEASLRLFAACGFRETGRKRDWLRTAEGWQDEVLLQRIL